MMDSRYIERYPKDSIVFTEGEPASSLYILLSGAVELTKRGEDGEILIRTITARKDFFGEMALIDGLPRSATARAIEDTSLLAVDASSFGRMLAANKAFAAKMVRVLVERIRRANLHLAEIVDLRIKGRLARAIVDFAERYGDPASLDARYVEIDRLTGWLHGHLGVTRETVDEELASLIRDGSLACAKIGQGLDEYLLVTGSFIRENDRRLEETRWDPYGPTDSESRFPGPGGRLSGRSVKARGDCEGDVCRFRPGSLIFREGELGDEMFILVDGMVELTKSSIKGDNLVRVVSARNDFFGEMALVDGKPRSATAMAIEEARLLIVGREAFEAMIETRPLFSQKIIKALSERIRATNSNLTEIIDTPPRDRIARAIADFTQRFGVEAAGGTRYLNLPTLKKWLNGHIGVSFDEADAAVAAGIAAGDFAWSGIHATMGEDIMVPESYVSAWDRRKEG
jgi:CRP/FNR family transcriptional regulator, cyclic AMP receptor protein